MEQSDKKNELLSFIQEYRLVREEDIMFDIRISMEEVQSTSQIVELSEKIRVLLCELQLTVKERHRLLNYTKSFLPLWMRVLQCSIEVSDYGGRIPVGILFYETKIELLLNLTLELLNSVRNKA